MTIVIEHITLTAKITVDIWDMTAGEVTAFKFKGNIYRIEIPKKPVKEPSKNPVKAGRKLLIETYIKSNNIKVLSLSKFYEDNPKQALHKARVEKHVSKLITDNKLVQFGKDKFHVTDKLLK